MKKAWFTFLIIMLVITVVVWGGYSFFLSNTDVDVHPEAMSKSRKINGVFDIETLSLVEESVNKQNIKTSTYHELDVNGNLYDDVDTNSVEEVIEP